MRELSKIWDTVNVKFLSTVRPFLRAPLKKKFIILRGESFTRTHPQNLARTKTPTQIQNKQHKTRFQRHTHIHTNNYQQTNKHETQVFKLKMRNVARFKPTLNNVLNAIYSAEWWCFKRMKKKVTENFCLLKHNHTHILLTKKTFQFCEQRAHSCFSIRKSDQRIAREWAFWVLLFYSLSLSLSLARVRERERV